MTEHLLVVGAGQMGAGIAQVALAAGLRVTLADVTVERAQSGAEKVRAGLSKLVSKGKMDEAGQRAALERLSLSGMPLTATDVDFAVEAVTENEELKRKTFAEMDRAVRAGGVLASNTSSISITRLAAATRRPESVVGMHFMNPVPVMQLVELIRGAATSEEAFQATLQLAKRMGKTPVVSKDYPGFIVNRILIPMLNEACFVLMEGVASAEDIDSAMKLGTAQPMGPLQLADFIGLDTCLAIAEVLHRGLGDDKYRPCPLLRQYVDAGWLGKKTGRGFYRYEGTKNG
jgi:3-hydroxybutyryl-CoA dehydrogenase